jgi:hypothetical protein
MQLFYFLLKANGRTFPDPEGQELLDQTAARRHATAIARELMCNRELETRSWRIQVCDDYLLPLFDVVFAEACERFRMYPTELQTSIARAARSGGALNDTFAQVQVSLGHVQETLARADQLLASISRSPQL